MKLKIVAIACVAFGYLFFLGIHIQDLFSYREISNCTHELPCMRVCCNQTDESCSSDEIPEKFSSPGVQSSINTSFDVRIIKGRPRDCPGTDLVKVQGGRWTIYYVSKGEEFPNAKH